MKLKNYQEEASQELFSKSLKLLSKKKGTIVFKSPTASGKTIILADFIKKLAQRAEREDGIDALSFVWIAPRALHSQSKIKLEKYYADTHSLECKFFNELSSHEIGKGREIGENEILFLNWEGVNKKDNIAIRDNEREDYLKKIVERTIVQGRKIILIIDESHYSASTAKAINLIKVLNSYLTIHVSATPEGNSEDEKVVIQIEDVKKEEMIKKSLVLNEGFDTNIQGEKIKNDLSTTKDLKEWVLEEALKKREELAKSFLAEGHNTNPLLLVQLPDDRRGDTDNKARREIEAILVKNGITKENGKLAIHFAEKKENIDNIDWDDGKAEVMLFKQAISLGWDCPRAHVLALFREWSSQVFSIQVLGRIMRVPLPEVGYYDDEILNHAYVYTSHEEVEIDKDFRNNDISLYNSQRKQDYKDIALPSIYRKQQRDNTRLDTVFIDIFQEEAENYRLKDKIAIEGQQITRRIIEETHLENIDETRSIEGKLEFDKYSIDDLQDYFNSFIKQNIHPLPPYNVTMARVRNAIYKFLKQECKVMYVDTDLLSSSQFSESQSCIDHSKKAIAIAISEKNENHFATVIQSAVEKYLAKEKKKNEFVQQPHWQVPEVIKYSSKCKKEKRQKSIMYPFYRQNSLSNIEREFIDHLENSDKVKWWFKNGDVDSPLYFSLSYKKNGKKQLFYVDFIVLLENGQIGLYDTKEGFTLDLAKEKMNGLRDYTDKNKNVIGGIVTKHNSAWRIAPQNLLKIDKEYVSEWDFLTDV